MNILLRDYLLYTFDVHHTIDIREPHPGGEMEKIGEEPTITRTTILAPKFNGQQVAELFVRDRLSIHPPTKITLIETTKLDGAVWFECA